MFEAKPSDRNFTLIVLAEDSITPGLLEPQKRPREGESGRIPLYTCGYWKIVVFNFYVLNS